MTGVSNSRVAVLPLSVSPVSGDRVDCSDVHVWFLCDTTTGVWGRVSRFVARDYRKPCRPGLSVTDFCTDFGFAGELQYLYNGMCGSMRS